jgi:Cys-tRNA(Pro) deacylase
MTTQRPITERLVAYLAEHNADFRVMEHEATRTSEDSARVRGTPLEQGAKALVFKADDRPVLLVVPANLRVDSRAFKTAFGVKNLRMISPDELRELTGLEVGAVPPFGSLLDMPTYVDERLLAQPRVSFNAGSRTTSIVMAGADYKRLANATVAHFASE